MDGTPESLETISRSLAKHGVTGFVGTTVTADWDVSIQAYKNMASAYQKGLTGAQLRVLITKDYSSLKRIRSTQ